MLAELLKNVLLYQPVLEPHNIPTQKSSKLQCSFINEHSYSSESLWKGPSKVPLQPFQFAHLSAVAQKMNSQDRASWLLQALQVVSNTECQSICRMLSVGPTRAGKWRVPYISVMCQGTELISGKGRQDFSPRLVDTLLCGAERKTLTPAWFFASMNTQYRLWQNVTGPGGEYCEGPWSLGVALLSLCPAYTILGHTSHAGSVSVVTSPGADLAPHSSSAGSHGRLRRSAPDKYWPENLA